jgi:hypothetical protein
MADEEAVPVQAVPLEHKLSKSIKAHGEPVETLTWREPTAGDIRQAGCPIILEFVPGSDGPRMTFNEQKMNALISILAAIPPSSVDQLSAGDWHAIAFKLSRFFMPTVG